MNATELSIPGVLLIEPRVFGDDRGFFFESFNRQVFREVTGLDPDFVQDNHSRSARHVLRGLHHQVRHTQGKLVRAVRGEVFDVAVDARRSSPTFGRWAGATLSEKNHLQLWIPQGFAHGFLVVSEVAEVLYKATDYYAPEWERSIRWNDPHLGIEWPLDGEEPILSAKDAAAPLLGEADLFD